LEYALVYDSYYGTLKEPITKALKRGLTVLLEIDVQGALQIKKSYPGKATFIFVFPPTFEELKKRLAQRRTETGEDLELRLKVAKEEIKLVEEYDFVIINDNLQKATAQLIDIIKSN
jgi:guanylate kinase